MRLPSATPAPAPAHRRGSRRGTTAQSPQSRADADQCANCRKEIVRSNKTQLQVHAETHDQKLWPKEKCWPNDFPTAT